MSSFRRTEIKRCLLKLGYLELGEYMCKFDVTTWPNSMMLNAHLRGAWGWDWCWVIELRLLLQQFDEDEGEADVKWAHSLRFTSLKPSFLSQYS